jgi:hypothetical protein
MAKAKVRREEPSSRDRTRVCKGGERFLRSSRAGVK